MLQMLKCCINEGPRNRQGYHLNLGLSKFCKSDGHPVTTSSDINSHWSRPCSVCQRKSHQWVGEDDNTNLFVGTEKQCVVNGAITKLFISLIQMCSWLSMTRAWGFDHVDVPTSTVWESAVIENGCASDRQKETHMVESTIVFPEQSPKLFTDQPGTTIPTKF